MAWYWRLSLRSRTILIGLLACLVVTLFWLELQIVTSQTSWHLGQEAIADQTMLLVRELELKPLEAQAAIRGYVISRKEGYLAAYSTAVIGFTENARRLAPALAHDPTLHTTLQTIDDLWAGWRQAFIEPEIERMARGSPADTSRIDQSATLLTEIRTMISQLRQQLHLQNAERQQLLLQGQERLKLLVLIQTVLAFGIIATYFYSFAERLAKEIGALVKGAEAVANGELGALVEDVSTQELGRLTHHFNAMSVSLERQSTTLRAQHQELLAQNEVLTHQRTELTTLKGEVEQERDQMASLNQLATRIQACDSLDHVCRQILAYVLERAQAEVGAIMLLRSEGEGYIAAQVGLSEEVVRAEKVVGLMQEAVRRNEVIVASYPEGGLLRPVFTTTVPVHHEAYLPIIYGGESLAVVLCGTTRTERYETPPLATFRTIADTLGALLANRLAYERLRDAYAQLQTRKEEIMALSESVARERDEAAQKRDLLHAVLNATGEGIFVSLGTAQDQFFYNDHFFRLLGLAAPSEGATVQEIEAITAPITVRLKLNETLRHLTENPYQTFHGRVEIGEAGNRILEWASAPVVERSGALLGRVYVARDITQAVESERLKQEFVATVSHELRTPLTSIVGYVELLLEGDLGELTTEQQEVLTVVDQNADQLLHLINDLLEVEKLSRGQIALVVTQIDLAELVERAVLMAEPVARAKGLDLRSAVDAKLPLIEGDEGRLLQVFTNLLSNAIKYTKQGSVTISAEQHDRWVRVAVTDTGIGIAPEHQRQLFSRFFRVDNAQTREVGGVGLGLAITRQLVEQHGGRVEVESQLGVGSTFTVWLPIQGAEGGGIDG